MIAKKLNLLSENDTGSKRDEAYPYRYVFAEAAGHTNGPVTLQTLPGALEWLWQSYVAPPAAQPR